MRSTKNSPSRKRGGAREERLHDDIAEQKEIRFVVA